MKIGVLTSSRADFGIYSSLLSKLKDDDFFHLEVIAFGSHLSKFHGFTIESIEKDQYLVVHKITSFLNNDDPQSISSSYGLTVLKFADFWNTHLFDLVFCLGDRFEMSAAVQAGIPFGVRFAHIHGGETTLGAIDNVYRHQITLASFLHFTATDSYAKKVEKIIGDSKNIFSVGSLSLEGIEKFNPIPKKLFLKKFNFPDENFALITFHPETIDAKSNFVYALELKKALSAIQENLFLVITMPNADTHGSIYRKVIHELKEQYSNRIACIENFGQENYFSAMYYSRIIIGNTSSGIIEAASFGKYVINIGSRQSGRTQSGNVINVGFEEAQIISLTEKYLKKGRFIGKNIYSKPNTSSTILEIVRLYFASL
uniref:UDP-N-acetylglucosamine 2-epimerase n=1 Tax=Algoriphagus sp. TaxID=1872435 RepID=UPI0040489EED